MRLVYNISMANNKHSKIIVDLANGESSITDTLYRLKILASDLDDTELLNWIEMELEGYKDNDAVPSYRMMRSPLYGKVQYVSLGAMITRDMPIPVKVEELDKLRVGIRENISSVEEWAGEKEDNRKMPYDVRLASQIADMNLSEMCQIMIAWFPMPASRFLEITNSVKNRLLDALMVLEKQYGNLDTYSIDFSDKKKNEAVGQYITNIIYNDNSVKIGSGNSINKSKVGDNE